MTVTVKVEFTDEEVRMLLLLLQGLVEEPWVSIRTKLRGDKVG